MEHDGTRTLAHPVVGADTAVATVLDQMAEVPTWSMTGGEQTQALQDIAQQQARLQELALRVVRQAETDGTGRTVGASSTASWWATTTQQTRPVCHGLVKLAAALDTDLYQPLRHALADGLVLVDQAQTIVKAIDALPTELVDTATRTHALTHLIGLAREHDAVALKKLGDHVLETVAPEVADQALADRLGTHTNTETGELKAMPLRLGEAFVEYITRNPAEGIAKAGGLPATVVVTIDLATLLGGIKPGILDTGQAISAGRARMIACEAGIVPAVLGGKSQVLDLGRTRRFFSPAQRLALALALALEQGGCTARGCDRPAGACHAHHDEPWHQGGATDKRHGRLLCPHDHARIHDPNYETTYHPDGTVSFHRRI